MVRLRTLGTLFGTLIVTAICGASVYTMIVPQTPRILYNKSDSAPIGWYKLNPDGAPMRDAMVAAFAPAEARNLADMRDYLPYHVPLLKSVWAVAGETVCSENGIIQAPNRPDIHAAVRDGLGRNLPHWEGCITLKDSEIFLVSTYVQNSFDSRYFGPVPINNILGTAEYLGENDESLEQIGLTGGLGAGLGAEGKIKDRGHPLRLTPCLHIFLRGPPKGCGGHPFFTQSLMSIDDMGVPPLDILNVYNGGW